MNSSSKPNDTEDLRVIALSTTLDFVLLLFSGTVSFGCNPDYKQIDIPEDFAQTVREQAWDVVVGLWPDFQFATIAAAMVLRQPDSGVHTFIYKNYGGATLVAVIRRENAGALEKSTRLIRTLDKLLQEVRSQSRSGVAGGLPFSSSLGEGPETRRAEGAPRVLHSLNNLLTVIFGCAEVLRQRLTADAEGTRYAEDLLKAANKAEQLVAGLAEPHPMRDLASTDVASLLAELRTNLRSMAGDKLKLTIQMTGNPGLVFMDQRQIEILIGSIVVYGRFVMPQGGLIEIAVDQVSLPRHTELWPLPAGLYVTLMFSYKARNAIPLAVAAPSVFLSEETVSEIGFSTAYLLLQRAGGGLAVVLDGPEVTSVTAYIPAVGSQKPPATVH